MEEFIDILDKDGKFTGIKNTKKEAHTKGLWHTSVSVWIFNSKGEILMQKRARLMHFPRFWDTSSSGHISAGEIPEHAASRELKEELGINKAPHELRKIGITKEILIRKEENFNNYEFIHNFILRYDGDIKKLKLQKEEIEKVKFINVDDFEKELNNPEKSKKYVPHKEIYDFIIKTIREELR